MREPGTWSLKKGTQDPFSEDRASTAFPLGLKDAVIKFRKLNTVRPRAGTILDVEYSMRNERPWECTPLGHLKISEPVEGVARSSVPEVRWIEGQDYVWASEGHFDHLYPSTPTQNPLKPSHQRKCH